MNVSEAARGRMSVRTKLVVGFGLFAITSAVVGGGGLAALRHANAASGRTATTTLLAVDDLLQAQRDMQEALVAERSLMFTRLGTPDADALLKTHDANVGRVAERWRSYRARTGGRGDFDAAWAAWVKTSRDVIGLLREDTASARRDAIDLSMSEGAVTFGRARAILADRNRAELEAAAAFAAAEQRRGAWVERAVAAAVAVTFLVAIGLGFLLARSIARPLAETAAVLRDLAEGDADLRVRLHARGGDEIGEVAHSFNAFLDKLGALVLDVRAAAGEVTSASRQLTGATTEISDGAQRQAASLEETAASLEELTGTVKQNAASARQASQLAATSRDVAERGGRVAEDAVAAMREINQASRKIGDIVTTIDEIAFQTNLLALNAAVEAARAGEQGRGFAVVAAEVRGLAQRCATAAREIKGLIGDSIGKVDAGAGLVTRSGETLAEIVEAVKRVTAIVDEIASASAEQAGGIDQVSRAVTQMDGVVQGNAVQAEALRSTAETMTGQAERLATLVGRFRVVEELREVPPPPARPVHAEPPRSAARAARPDPAPAPTPVPSEVVLRAPGTNGHGTNGHGRLEGFEEF